MKTPPFPPFTRALIPLFFVGALSACSGENDEPAEETEPPRLWECTAEPGMGGAGGEEFDSLPELGCSSDFEAASAEPSSSSLPGARSVKTLIDRVDENRLYFMNTDKYPLHYEFASEHLSATGDLPVVPSPAEFNDNYFTSQRRFLLGAVTYYSGPDKWAYEISPYDTASPEMIVESFTLIRDAAYFGKDLHFHPSGDAVERTAKELEGQIPIVSTDELYEGTDYQALNLGTGCGRLIFMTAEELASSHISFQDIVVLDAVPNDISVAQGIVTGEFQTPLSHVNVLSQNRRTPNMALRGVFDLEEFREFEGEWVELTVGAFDYSITAIDSSDAETCIKKPDPINVTPMNLDVTELADIETLYDPDSEVSLRDQVAANVPAYGGKASHFGPLAHIEEANAPKAFSIPVYYYNQFMVENGFSDQITALLADEEFLSDASVRDQALTTLRDEMVLAPINEDFLALLVAKLEDEYPGVRMRFRSSTNAEDLGDFTGAGLYTSKSGEVGDVDDPIEDAIREVWSSVWFFRAFEERQYYGIDHTAVGMALLVHNSFPDEDANGVAVTANPFDSAGVEPGFYINVQEGEASVVQPDRGITTDQFIYYYSLQGQPSEFLGHSNLIPEGETVLTPEETHRLGIALEAIHQFFYPAYGSDNESGWYAMDTEFKFDADENGDSILYVKQARPYPGRN